MNTEPFKLRLAAAIAAKTGITPRHAKTIVHHVVNLPQQKVQKTFELPDIGRVVVSNRKATMHRKGAFVGGIELAIPYETVVNFKVGDKPKKLTLRAIQEAKGGLFDKYKLFEFDNVVFGGLEGDPDVKRIRRRQKKLNTFVEPLEGEPEGNPDTERRRRNG